MSGRRASFDGLMNKSGLFWYSALPIYIQTEKYPTVLNIERNMLNREVWTTNTTLNEYHKHPKPRDKTATRLNEIMNRVVSDGIPTNLSVLFGRPIFTNKIKTLP